MEKSETYYVILDCVECDDPDEYRFKCDTNVRLTLQDAAKKAWEVLLAHYTRLSGHPPADDAMKTEFFDAMASSNRSYCIDVTETRTVTLEILERSAS